MGHGSRGSRVSLPMGQMGHGSQNVTHCQYWHASFWPCGRRAAVQWFVSTSRCRSWSGRSPCSRRCRSAIDSQERLCALYVSTASVRVDKAPSLLQFSPQQGKGKIRGNGDAHMFTFSNADRKKLFRSPIYLAILVYAALKGRYMTARLRITLARPFCC